MCHKGQDAYVLILLRTAFLKTHDTDSFQLFTDQAARHVGISVAG